MQNACSAAAAYCYPVVVIVISVICIFCFWTVIEKKGCRGHIARRVNFPAAFIVKICCCESGKVEVI